MSRAVTPAEPALPDSSYLVLGVLAFVGESSGYDIHRWAEGLGHLYALSAHSLVYRELKRLDGQGMVAARDLPQQGRPDKRLYRITEAGRAALRDWIERRPVELPTLKHTVALRLFFGRDVASTALQGPLIDYLERVEEQLAQLAVVEEALADDPDQRRPALAVRWSARRLRAERDGAREALAALIDDERQPPTNGGGQGGDPAP